MVECGGGGRVLGSGGNMAEMDKKRVCFCCAHSYIYNFLASYGSLKDDDPNRYLIDLST